MDSCQLICSTHRTVSTSAESTATDGTVLKRWRPLQMCFASSRCTFWKTLVLLRSKLITESTWVEYRTEVLRSRTAITFKRLNPRLTTFLNSSTGSNLPHLRPVGQSLLVESLWGLKTGATGWDARIMVSTTSNHYPRIPFSSSLSLPSKLHESAVCCLSRISLAELL